ncbi:hypothetical protein VKT23_015474 [Stygiomarasmius scandens]|uniref:Beta-xylanase n=1 Tax=Marasmiellus scandens TaxID=2682957 RepID=A0ABR1IXZ8_9AGAR
MKLSASLASLLPFILLVTAQSTDLNDAAVAAGKLYFGTETDAGTAEMSDSAFLELATNSAMFGQITAGNSFKWDSTEPAQGQFSFTNSDALAAFAQQNGQILRGHNCVWYNQLPSWVSSGGFDASTLTGILQDHVTTVVDHFKGQIWDVVNEPFNDDGTQRSFVFTDTIGPSYIDTALQAAQAADPDAKLYINDYNIEGSGAKASAMMDLIQDLKSRDIPIDGVGLQGHFIVGELPSDLQETLQAFADLGVEVAYTELDIRTTLPATQDMLDQQQQDYQTVVSACMAVEQCVGVTMWGFTDKYSWIPGTFSGMGAALPWDEDFQTKPAYDGIVAALG